MRVDDEVGTSGVEGRPELLAEERVLKHERDSLVNLGDAGEDTVDVGVDPIDTVVGKTGRGGEPGEVVTGLVDRGDGERVLATGSLDEGQDRVNGLEAVVEVGGVLEPGVVSESFTNGKGVDTTGQRVETDNNVHVVLVDGVVGQGSEVSLLVTRVKHAAGDLGPGCVSGRDTKSVDTLGTHLVDVGSGEERSIALLEERSTNGETNGGTPGPLIGERSNIGGPPLSIAKSCQHEVVLSYSFKSTH